MNLILIDPDEITQGTVLLAMKRATKVIALATARASKGRDGGDGVGNVAPDQVSNEPDPD